MRRIGSESITHAILNRKQTNQSLLYLYMVQISMDLHLNPNNTDNNKNG